MTQKITILSKYSIAEYPSKSHVVEKTKTGEIQNFIYLEDFTLLPNLINDLIHRVFNGFWGIIKVESRDIELFLNEIIEQEDTLPLDITLVINDALIFEKVKFQKIKDYLYLFSARDMIPIYSKDENKCQD